MSTRDRVLLAIYRAIDEINRQLPADRRLDRDPATPLRGPTSRLDSLHLVNLVVTTEELVEEEFGRYLNLADERAVAREPSPFERVETLADYVTLLLRDGRDGIDAS